MQILYSLGSGVFYSSFINVDMEGEDLLLLSCSEENKIDAKTN